MRLPTLKKGFEPLICEGDAFARGQTQGEALQRQIHLCLNAFYQSPLYARLRSKRMPRRWSDYFLHQRARKHIIKSLQEQSEHYQFLQGLARGSGIPLNKLLLFCAVESLLSGLKHGPTPGLGQCSMVLVPGNFSSTGEPLLMKNVDYPYFLKSFNLWRSSKPTEGIENLSLTLSPQSGCHTGMNTSGLAITYNTTHGPDTSPGRLPASMHIQEALRLCHTAEEAVTWLQKQTYEGGCIVGIMDREQIFLMEIYGTEIQVKPIENRVLMASNHYQLMPEHNPPASHCYTDPALPELKDTRTLASSEARLDRINELAGTKIHFHPQDLLEFFQDHGSSREATDNTLCRHGRFYETTASVLLMPNQREARFTLNAPCEANYVSYQWY